MELLPHLIKFCALAVVMAGAACLLVKAVYERRGVGSTTGWAQRLFVYRPAAHPQFKPLSSLQLWAKVISLFLITRLVIFGASYSYAATAGHLKTTFFQTIAHLWKKYDSIFYLNIAEYGYHAEGAQRFSIVFYPLYSALVRLFRFIVPEYFLSGMVVSNLFLLIGMYYLVRLAEWEWKDSDAALASAKYFVLFPFSFFMSIVYTESVFVTLCILSFYSLRRDKWILAGLFAMLAAFTRNQGVLLAIPILIEFVSGLNRERFRTEGVRRMIVEAAPKLVAVLLPAVGTFLYLLVNKWVTGEWFRFLLIQRDHWKQQFGFFGQNLANHVHKLLYLHTVPFSLGIWIPELVMFFASFFLLIYMTNKIRLSYLVFSFVYLFISFAPTGLLSGARYVSGMFTLYLFLACAAHKLSSFNRSLLDWFLLFFLIFYTVLFQLGFVF